MHVTKNHTIWKIIVVLTTTGSVPQKPFWATIRVAESAITLVVANAKSLNPGGETLCGFLPTATSAMCFNLLNP